MGYELGRNTRYGQPLLEMALSPAMARKHPRPDADIARLASDLAASWTAADGIEPWLRTHVPRLTRMIQDESWSWSDIARALTVAGIQYKSGRPWTGTFLAVKAAEVRAQRKKRAHRRAIAELAEDVGALKERLRAAGTSSPPLPPPVETRPTLRPASIAATSQPPPPRTGTITGQDPAAGLPRDLGTTPPLTSDDDDDGPRFELVSFADGWTPPLSPPQPPSESKPPPKPKRRFDPDEVLRRLHGRGTPTSSEEKE